MNDIKRALLSEELTLAAEVLSQFCNGADLEKTFETVLVTNEGDKGRKTSGQVSTSAVKEFVYRAVRSLRLLQAITSLINSKPPAPWLMAMQQLVIAQLLHVQNNRDEIASNARVVDQAIEAVKANSEFAFAAGFVNATLRRFLRERDALLTQANQNDEAKHNYPFWWLKELERNYALDWQELARAGDAQAPFCLRINQRFGSVEDYHSLLSATLPDVKCTPVTSLGNVQALIVEPAMAVRKLPGFAQGRVSVQDAGAQLAAHFLELNDGQAVLDACAAPGGKTVHCLELADVNMTALDVSADRLARVAENLSRFRAGAGESSRPCILKVGDARTPSQWWDGKLFDRILADVPCSASGIVRRHPDIRWRRQRGDLATFSIQQVEILNGLWPLLRPGGKLLYVTCSLFAAEGQEVISQFLQGRRNVMQEPLTDNTTGVLNLRDGYLLPKAMQDRITGVRFEAEHDGFFFARLVKTL
jgi:16S rRNA (cytosine967-C5)-methyltransferase